MVPDDTLLTPTLAYTNRDECSTINDTCFNNLCTRGAERTYIFAHHIPSTQTGLGAVDFTDAKQISLLSYKNKTYDSPLLKVAIGFRMRLTSNIATQLGISSYHIHTNKHTQIHQFKQTYIHMHVLHYSEFIRFTNTQI